MKRLLPFIAALFAGCASPGGSGGAVPSQTRVDLTQRVWFPPVTAQQGFSCSQQAGLYYAFTAEWNQRAGLDAGSPARRFSPYFAYSLLAGESSGRSYVVDGWITGQQTGVPLEIDSPRYTNAVMHGYDRYLRAMQHKVKRWLILPMASTADVARAQQRLAEGHPLVCDFQIKGTIVQRLPADANCRAWVQRWGSTGPGHAMLYAGYDASMEFDANGDGRITTDADITGDGRVTLADCERGAFLVINPWGGAWGDRGRAWVPVRLHGESTWPWSRSVAQVEVAEPVHPRLVLKLSLSAADRQNVIVNVSDGSRTVQPWMFSHDPVAAAGVSMWEAFTSLRSPGPHLTRGALGGPGGGPLESGHDLSQLSATGSYSLTITPAGRGPLRGELRSASIMEYDSAGTLLRETPVTGLPAALPSGGGTWTSSR